MRQVCLVFTLLLVYVKCQISLEYKPMRPFYYPKPSGTHIKPIVPPESPLPGGAPNLVDRFKPDKIPPYEDEDSKKPTPEDCPCFPNRNKNPEFTATSSFDNKNVTSPTLNLEYKPNRPPFHPNPGSTLGQVVPPGKPWPSNESQYQNFSQVFTNFEDSATPDKVTIVDRIDVPSTTKEPQGQGSINIEYKPNRPSFHPSPGSTLGQVVPPGKPWPSNPQGYQNFTQITPNSEDTTTSNKVTIVDRIDIPSTSGTTKKPQGQGSIDIEYKPNRPFFHPNPGNTLGQVVPPGKPWPSNPQGYQNFSQVPDLTDRFKVETTSVSGFTWLSPEDEKTEGVAYLESKSPNLINRIKEDLSTSTIPTSLGQIITSTKIFTSATLKNRIQDPTTSKPSQDSPLDYKPTRPTYHPNPGDNIAPIVPPGKPWPSHENSTNLLNRIKEIIAQKPCPDPVGQNEEKKPTISDTSPVRGFSTIDSEGYRRVETKWSPFVPLPFNLLPSHYILYV